MKSFYYMKLFIILYLTPPTENLIRIKSKSPTLIRCSMGSVVGTVTAKVRSIFEKSKFLSSASKR